MESGIDLARALLDQLRRDAKRFAPGRSVELSRAAGRSPRYLERVKPENLKLHEAFGAMRYLGFTPLEFAARLLRRHRWIPPGASGFFRRRRLARPDRSGLRDLEAFVAWGRDTLIDDPAPPYCFDLEKQLESLGLVAGPLDVLSAANSLFSILARHRPGTISRETARQLIRSSVAVSGALRAEGHLPATCEILDLGFYLEQRVNDLELRCRLFEVGATGIRCQVNNLRHYGTARRPATPLPTVPGTALGSRVTVARPRAFSSACTSGLPSEESITEYRYDCNGNLSDIWDANHPSNGQTEPPSTEYSYDALDRLVEVRQPFGGAAVADPPRWAVYFQREAEDLQARADELF